ncbi:MAG: Hpt domain-containing protein [Lachnospiraceae bacterium]|jgi:two-component system chemotaxis sensor kinase CheA|nr:Hpt domain-containing protein [Lachnospiraceae bacterium]
MQSYIGVEDNFLLENGYLVARLEEIVLAAEEAQRFTQDDINELFRSMHTIKSSAGIMMYENISILAHKLEDVFYYLRETYPPSVPHEKLVEGILLTADFITAQLVKIQAGEVADGDATEIIAYLEDFLHKIKEDIGTKSDAIPENRYIQPTHFYVAPKAGEAKKYYRISLYYRLGTQMSNVRAYSTIFALKPLAEEMIFSPASIMTDNDTAGIIMREGFHIQIQSQYPEEKLRELVADSSGEKEIEITDSSVEEFLRGFPEKTGEFPIIRLDDDWREGDQEEELVPGAYVIQKEAGKGTSLVGNRPSVSASQDMISIPTEKIDQLSELVEELAASRENGDRDRLIEQIQEMVFSMQKVPFKLIARKLNRAVYDISRKLNKVVECTATGEDIEIDRSMTELLSEALIHILRNAVDHGIEDKRERQGHGKMAKGQIQITVTEGQEELCIAVSDDGKGIDADQIFAEAAERQLTGGKERHSLTDKDIYQFILLPGFSTNRQVTEYSGRGVGLDVVVQNLNALNGWLEVDAQPGQGTTMTIWLPNRNKSALRTLTRTNILGSATIVPRA